MEHNRGGWTRYAALGDSFTEGLDDEIGPDGRHRGWADLVALDLAERARSAGLDGIDYANLAVRGRLVDQVVREQVPAAIALQPDLVSLAVGINDCLRRRFDLDALATSLENGVRDLRAGGTDVLVFAFGDPSRRSKVMGLIRERIRVLNSAVDAIARAHGCYTVHFWDVAAMDDDRLWSDDRLHLSPTGHRLAAACALEALGVGGSEWRTPPIPEPRPPLPHRVAGDARWVRGHLAPWLARRARGMSSRRRRPPQAAPVDSGERGSLGWSSGDCPVASLAPTRGGSMPGTTGQPERPGERNGRPQLTREGYARLLERAQDIRERRLPAMRPLLIESERDERLVADFERLLEEVAATDALLGNADIIEIDPLSLDGRADLGMRVHVVLQDGSRAWVRPVHPEEAFLDEERISAASPLAIALVGARAGHTVWVDAPTGAWPCEVLAMTVEGVTATT